MTGLYVLCYACLAASIWASLAGNPLYWGMATLFFFILRTWR